MSPVVGSDVSGARIHRGPRASELAAQHDAAAFAVGPHVVMGPNAPKQGIVADVLLAHELVHTAQQRDAAANPTERHKPIGLEDDAAERDAGAERLARLGHFAGSVGDVMRTGLQLQRCDSHKLPAGPPMSGKEADAAVATVPMIAERIQGDLEKGINAENRTHFYDSKEEYVRAWREKSTLMGRIWAENKTPKQLDEMRLAVARQQADAAPGFTNDETDEIHIYRPGTPAFVTIHELIHLHTRDEVHQQLGDNFIEGAADYFTVIVCKQNHIPYVVAYDAQVRAVTRLAQEIGDEALADLVFNGAIDQARQLVDAKAAGTWAKYRSKLQVGKYDEANALLDGVSEANRAREAERRAQEEMARSEQAAKLAKEREAWPPEGTKATSGRMIGVSVVAGKGHATIARGGKDGVREGWTARAKLESGEMIDAVLVSVATRTCVVEVPTLQVASDIESVELRPGGKR